MGQGQLREEMNSPEAVTKREQAWTEQQYKNPQFTLIENQRLQKVQEEAQKKNALELTSALKFQKQFAASALGKSGTLLTNPAANGVTVAPPPGQKTLLGQ